MRLSIVKIEAKCVICFIFTVYLVVCQFVYILVATYAKLIGRILMSLGCDAILVYYTPRGRAVGILIPKLRTDSEPDSERFSWNRR